MLKYPNLNTKYLFLWLWVLVLFMYGCKPKFQGEIKPEFLPKHNKTGVSTAKKWWQNQKANPQNLQQKGGEPNFEDVFVPDWTNAESRTSQKGKLQIRVPLLQNGSLHTPIFIPFTDEKGVKHFGTIELLLQANPDSTFKKIYNVVGTTDSTNRFDFSKNNFFRKEDNFQGKEVFFDAQIKKSILLNEFLSRNDTKTYVVVKLAGICVTFVFDLKEDGKPTLINVRFEPCSDVAGGGSAGTGWGNNNGNTPINTTPSVQYFSDAGWQWVYAGGSSGNGGGSSNPPDPFEPPMDDDISGINTNLIEGTIWGTAYNNLKRSQKFNTLISRFEDEPNNLTIVNNHRQLIFTLGNETTLDATHNLKATTSNQLNTLKCEIICDNTPPPPPIRHESSAQMNALMPVRYSKILHKSSQMLLQVMSAQSHTLVMLYLEPTHTNSNHFVNLINPYSWAEPNRSILVDIKSAYTEFPFSVNKSKEIINGQVISITTDPELNKDWKKTNLKMLTKKYPVGGYKYIRQMAEILKETDASTNNIAFYEAIVWFNLRTTDAWKNMPLEEKLPIEKIQKDFGF